MARELHEETHFVAYDHRPVQSWLAKCGGTYSNTVSTAQDVTCPVCLERMLREVQDALVKAEAAALGDAIADALQSLVR